MIEFNNFPFSHMAMAEMEDWLTKVANQRSFRAGRLLFHFVDDEDIRRVNKEYLQHDYVTDIITFDYSNGRLLNAEFFICWPQVQRQALDLKETIPREFARVCAHGLLHLCGFDDQNTEDQRKMRQEEEKVLTFAPLKNLITS